MIEREINTLAVVDAAQAERVVEQVCAKAGLWVSGKGPSRAEPGGVRWHLKLAGEPGVLELTLWPSRGRARMSVHDGRGADWMPAMVEKIVNDLTSRL